MVRLNSTLFCCFLLAIIGAVTCDPAKCPSFPDKVVCGTVYVDAMGNYMLQTGMMDPMGAAYGYYRESLETIGWGVLEVRAGYSSTGNFTDSVTAFAAGYLEGAVTGLRIYQNTINSYSSFFGGASAAEVQKVRNFFAQQDTWMRAQIQMNPNDPYWQHVSYVVAQLDGLMRGYRDNFGHTQPLDDFSFQWLTASGDLLDIIPAVNRNMRPQFDKMTKEQVGTYLAKNSRCSALIKLLAGFENIFMSHSTWFIYNTAMRIYKTYDINLKNQLTANRRSSFSSYAGFMVSTDDFYVIENGLVMLETTNGIINTSLYDMVTPNSLLAWQRVRLSNYMAQNGSQWAMYIAKYNSGTYNNQYMIIDLNKVHLSTRIDADALWVIEQIPGLVVSGDQTAILREGYWPSYNVPFFELIFNRSGYPSLVDKYGPDYTHELAPRAKIFRRDEGKVVDMQSMQDLMRYNDYKNDVYSKDDACNSICCRGDLRAGSAQFAGGCMDTKVTDYSMAFKLNALAISGPTVSHGLPPFSWDTPAFQNVSHIGLPTTSNFDFVSMNPILV